MGPYGGAPVNEYADMPDEDTYVGAVGSTGAVRLTNLIPGGMGPTGVETWVALIVLAALGFLILTRRGLADVLAK
jgi:hypothetical protein